MVEAGKDYTVNTTGTPSEKLRFGLSSDAQTGVMVRVLYDNVGSKTVKANGNVVQPQDFDDEQRLPRELDKVTCGENRFVSLANYLEFYITPGCKILIEPNDSI